MVIGNSVVVPVDPDESHKSIESNFNKLKKRQIVAKGIPIEILATSYGDRISMTDIAKFKDPVRPDKVIQVWMSTLNTINFLIECEHRNNPDFNLPEFGQINKMASMDRSLNCPEFGAIDKKPGTSGFAMSPKLWTALTHTKWIITKSGRYGGTYAHKYIAIKFAAWLSSEFEYYVISEFDRLKAKESKSLTSE